MSNCRLERSWSHPRAEWTKSDGTVVPVRAPVQLVTECPIGMEEIAPTKPLRKILNEIATVRTADGRRFCIPSGDANGLEFAERVYSANEQRREAGNADAEALSDNLINDPLSSKLNAQQLMLHYLRSMRIADGDEEAEERAADRLDRRLSRALKGGMSMAEIDAINEDELVEDALGSDASSVASVDSDTDSMASDSSYNSDSSASSIDSNSSAQPGALAGGKRSCMQLRSSRACRWPILKIAQRIRGNDIMMRCLNLYLVQQRWALLMLLEAQRRLDATNDAVLQEQIANNVVDLQPSPIRTLLVPRELEDAIITALMARRDEGDDKIIYRSTDGQVFSVPQVVVGDDKKLKVEKMWCILDNDDDRYDDSENELNQTLFNKSVVFEGTIVKRVHPNKLVQLQDLEEIQIRRRVGDTEADAKETVYTIAYPEPSIIIWMKCAGKKVKCDVRQESALNDLCGPRTALSELADLLHEHFMYTPQEDSERLLVRRNDKMGAAHWANILRCSRKCIEKKAIREAQKARREEGTVGVGLRVATRPSAAQRRIASALNVNKISRKTRKQIEEMMQAVQDEQEEEKAPEEEEEEGEHGLGGGARGDPYAYDSDRSIDVGFDSMRGGCGSSSMRGGCGSSSASSMRGGCGSSTMRGGCGASSSSTMRGGCGASSASSMRGGCGSSTMRGGCGLPWRATGSVRGGAAGAEPESYLGY